MGGVKSRLILNVKHQKYENKKLEVKTRTGTDHIKLEYSGTDSKAKWNLGAVH